MVVLTKVLDTTKKNGRAVIKVMRLSKHDIQTATQAAPFGFNSSPVADYRAVFTDTLKKGVPVVIGYISKFNECKDGESMMYSTNSSGEQQTYIYLNNEGNIEIGGKEDNAVGYAELKKGFDQLKEDFNAFVEKYNLHTHSVSGAATGAPVTPNIATPTDADISQSKKDKILLP